MVGPPTPPNLPYTLINKALLQGHDEIQFEKVVVLTNPTNKKIPLSYRLVHLVNDLEGRPQCHAVFPWRYGIGKHRAVTYKRPRGGKILGTSCSTLVFFDLGGGFNPMP